MKKILCYTYFLWLTLYCAIGQSPTTTPKLSDLYTIKGDSTYKYIWKIRMQNAKNTEEYIMTGFKIADPFNSKNQETTFLASALHGWAKAKGDFKEVKAIAEFYTIERVTTIGAKIECNLNVVAKNLVKDLVIFKMSGCEYNVKDKHPFDPLGEKYRNEGLKIGAYTDSSKYIAYGFPGTKDLQPNTVTVSDNAYSTIYKLVGSNQTQLDVITNLGSPYTKTEVIALMANDIQPGLSGSPIVNKKTQQVIAMGDGALLNHFNAQVKSWAIVLEPEDIITPKDDDIDKLIKDYSLLQKGLLPGLFSTKDYNRIDAPVSKEIHLKAKPRILLSTYYKPPVKGLDYYQIKDINSTISSKSALIDASIDVMPFKKLSNFLLGIYYNQVSLNYDIQTKDENGLPPNISAKNYTQTNKLLGLQSTVLISQGAFHHIYLGAGMGGQLNNTKIINNYRAYAGYRYYPFHQQRLSLDLKLLCISTKEQFLMPNPFGNATIKKSNLNQLNLCVGLNLSI